MKILGIDPGCDTSGVVHFDSETRRVIEAWPDMPNAILQAIVRDENCADAVACECIEAMYAHVGKETVRTIVTNLVETINHCPSMSEQSKMAFVLGYVRGAIGVLRIECEDQDVQFSALPHLLDMLDTLNQGGVRALRTLAENVAGAELLEAEEKARIDSLLPSIEPPLLAENGGKS